MPSFHNNKLSPPSQLQAIHPLLPASSLHAPLNAAATPYPGVNPRHECVLFAEHRRPIGDLEREPSDSKRVAMRAKSIYFTLKRDLSLRLQSQRYKNRRLMNTTREDRLTCSISNKKAPRIPQTDSQSSKHLAALYSSARLVPRTLLGSSRSKEWNRQYQSE